MNTLLVIFEMYTNVQIPTSTICVVDGNMSQIGKNTINFSELLTKWKITTELVILYINSKLNSVKVAINSLGLCHAVYCLSTSPAGKLIMNLN